MFFSFFSYTALIVTAPVSLFLLEREGWAEGNPSRPESDLERREIDREGERARLAFLVQS